MSDSRSGGTLLVLAAYSLWGVLPLYWKALAHASSGVILAHRIIWALVFTTAILTATKNWTATRAIFRQGKLVATMVGAAFLISANWWLYIWAVNDGRIVETSFGYYINPLVSVALGVAVQKERLSKSQLAALSLAGIGVVIMGFGIGQFPFVAFGLALSFGFYGLLKKRASVPALTSLHLETLFAVPLALTLLIPAGVQAGNPWGCLPADVPTVTLLLLAGPVTAIPLWLFGAGARRVTMVRLGFLQYLNPTIGVILGVFVFHEDFNGIKAAAFVCTWLAMAVFLTGEIRKRKAVRENF